MELTGIANERIEKGQPVIFDMYIGYVNASSTSTRKKTLGYLFRDPFIIKDLLDVIGDEIEAEYEDKESLTLASKRNFTPFFEPNAGYILNINEIDQIYLTHFLLKIKPLFAYYELGIIDE